MARSLALILLSGPLLAQFSHFAATDDGRQIYFTSTLPLAGDPPGFGESKIFRIGESGLELFATSTLPATLNSRAGATAPQVSGDGQTVGLTRDGNGELLGVGATVLGPGVLAMSRNALWAVLTVSIQQPPPINSFSAQSTVINLATGERTIFNFPQALSGTIGMIASDGTVVIPSPSGPSLWRQGVLSPVTLPASSNIVALSDNAHVLLYVQIQNVSPANPRQRLVARDLLTGNETTIVDTFPPYPNTGVVVTGLSNDGQWVLYLVTGSNQGAAFVANTTTGQSIALRFRAENSPAMARSAATGLSHFL